MSSPFDFSVDETGELIIENNEILTKTDSNLRVQTAFNIIKSTTTEWFVDHVGANLESIIGRPCNENTAEYGKTLIKKSLIDINLFEDEDIFIKAEIKNNSNITYDIYLKVVLDELEQEIETVEIIAELDLVKGINIRYGWEPRR